MHKQKLKTESVGIAANDDVEVKTRLLRLPEVLERTALSQSSVYRLIADNGFPSPVRLSKRSVAWVEHEVEGWIADRLRARG